MFYLAYTRRNLVLRLSEFCLTSEFETLRDIYNAAFCLPEQGFGNNLILEIEHKHGLCYVHCTMMALISMIIQLYVLSRILEYRHREHSVKTLRFRRVIQVSIYYVLSDRAQRRPFYCYLSALLILLPYAKEIKIIILFSKKK